MDSSMIDTIDLTTSTLSTVNISGITTAGPVGANYTYPILSGGVAPNTISISNNSTGAISSRLTIDGADLADFIKDLKTSVDEIQKRLAIIQPNLELHEKFAALREAYENYKLIEALVIEEFSKESK